MKIKSAIIKKIRSYDMFGHYIHLNFNRNGTNHKTTAGGMCSILLKICVGVILVVSTLKLILRWDAT